jgi:[ribosomal protein S5]-alanine N-acetyltransferase
MTQLQTARLVVRNFLMSDCDALRAMIIQFQASQYAAFDHAWPTSPDEIRHVTAWFARGDSFLAVCLKDTGQFIGYIALSQEPAEDGRVYNLGYCFAAEYHGQGYASEACRAVLGHAFDDLQAHAVVAGTAAANLPSRRLLQRLGFKKTAEMMTSFSNAADGTALEFLGYSFILSRDDWQSAGKDAEE